MNLAGLMDPRSPRFLDVRFKRVRFFLWRHWSRRDRLSLYVPGSLDSHLRHLERVRTILACPHLSRRPNPKATAVLDRNPEVCNDCGIGILNMRRRP